MSLDVSTVVKLGRVHATRLKDVYRSAGWPSQDKVEIELIAAGLLRRVSDMTGRYRVELTDDGVKYLALAFHNNRQARSAHESLVDLVAETMMRDGRIVWTGLSLRAQLVSESQTKNEAQTEPSMRWRVCMPDVFSIRNTTVAGYLEPVVHEIKVSRADLLGDLKSKEKRGSYLDVAGQCWYVLGNDSKGRCIAKPEEIPNECGVLVLAGRSLEVVRNAPKRSFGDLPFSMWMALAKAKPLQADSCFSFGAPSQAMLKDV